MKKSDNSEEIKALKKALRQEQKKNKVLKEKYDDIKLQYSILKCTDKKKARKLLLSSLSEKERLLVEMLFPDIDTER